MIVVILLHNTGTQAEDVILETVSLEQHFQTKLTFSYYRELDHQTVLTAMKPVDPTQQVFHVFVKLVDNEPVDLTADEVIGSLLEHPEFIPDDI